MVTPKSILSPFTVKSGEYNTQEWVERKTEFLRSHPVCRSCGLVGVEKHVHHKNYVAGRRIWEYQDHELCTLCGECHNTWTLSIQAFRREFSESNASDFSALVALLIECKKRHGERWIVRKLFAEL